LDTASGAIFVLFLIDFLAAVRAKRCLAFGTIAIFDIDRRLADRTNAIEVLFFFDFLLIDRRANLLIFGDKDRIVFLKHQSTVTTKNGRWINLILAARAINFKRCPACRTLLSIQINRRIALRTKFLATISTA
jgi:hypothetical protein